MRRRPVVQSELQHQQRRVDDRIRRQRRGCRDHDRNSRRLCRLNVTISDRPGGLARFASIVAEEGGSIIEINHDRAFASDDITTVVVHCVIETRDAEHISILRNRLAKEGFTETV